MLPIPGTASPIPSTAPSDPGRERAPGEAPQAGMVEGPTQIADGKPSWRERWRLFPSNTAMVITLFVLMGIGAFFRFWRIGVQAYWTDESYTINRIRGDFRWMLASLSDQGFPPGWYVLLRWWTMAAEYFTGSTFTPLTSPVTRSFTALIGVLTIPAMYFLARQFTDRKGALLVALLTAVNPYLIYYSRDIKMYPAVWLFIILNIAIFFKWQSTHRHLIWFPLYLVTGFLMIAMHSTAWFMIALQLIFLLTRPRMKSWEAPLWTAAVGIMALLPIYWYLNQTNWVDRLIERGGDSGLSWVTNYTDMSWKTIASLPCSHLLGYLYPSFPPDPLVRRWFVLGSDFDRNIATRAWPWMANLQFWVAVAFAGILSLGLIPWRGFRRSPERRQAATRYRFWWIVIWLVLPTVCLALTWIPPESPWFKWVWGASTPKPIWEPRYLGMLIPPLILWLAASLRRLPTWPLRVVAIVFVVAASIVSALSNHLILRNSPFHRAADVAVRYYDPADARSLAVGHIDLPNPARGYTVAAAYDIARNVRPLTPGVTFLSPDNFNPNLWSWQTAYQFLRDTRMRPEVKTIVLTDRQGDVTDPKDRLSTESLNDHLGPRWKLVQEEKYVLHHEWRFYIFNTWRTRVWVRQAKLEAPIKTE